mmetsp:Transcript_18046/g.27774  ORF Transcript_18046/g.27774 Transcript_18046/m.27774 type:complete len:849 (+) Transcript_18046:3925-6471(+)
MRGLGQLSTGHVPRADPADLLDAVVAGDDPIADLQVLDFALTHRRRNQRAGGKAGDDILDIGEGQRARRIAIGVEVVDHTVLWVAGIVDNIQRTATGRRAAQIEGVEVVAAFVPIHGLACIHVDERVAVVATRHDVRAAVATVDGVVASTAVDDIVAGCTGDAVIAATTVQGVVASAAIKNVVAFAAIDAVCTVATKDRVAAVPTVQGVRVPAPVDKVIVVAAKDGVVALTTQQAVVTGPTVNQVVVDLAVNGVVAFLTKQLVIVIGAKDNIVAVATEHGVHAIVGARIRREDRVGPVILNVQLVQTQNGIIPGIDGVVAAATFDQVIALTTDDTVIARRRWIGRVVTLDEVIVDAAVNHVIAVTTDDGVCVIAGRDGVVAVPAVNRVQIVVRVLIRGKAEGETRHRRAIVIGEAEVRQELAVAGVDHIISGAAFDCVAAVASVDLVIIGPAIDAVVARAAVDGVFTLFAVQRVVAWTTMDLVIAGARVDAVVAFARNDRVIAAACFDDVVIRIFGIVGEDVVATVHNVALWVAVIVFIDQRTIVTVGDDTVEGLFGHRDGPHTFIRAAIAIRNLIGDFGRPFETGGRSEGQRTVAIVDDIAIWRRSTGDLQHIIGVWIGVVGQHVKGDGRVKLGVGGVVIGRWAIVFTLDSDSDCRRVGAAIPVLNRVGKGVGRGFTHAQALERTIGVIRNRVVIGVDGDRTQRTGSVDGLDFQIIAIGICVIAGQVNVDGGAVFIGRIGIVIGHRTVIDAIHCDHDIRRVRAAIPVRDGVGDRRFAVEIIGRRERQGVVTVDHHFALLRWHHGRDHVQLIAIHVAVIGQHGDVDRGVLVSFCHIVFGHRTVIDSAH